METEENGALLVLVVSSGPILGTPMATFGCTIIRNLVVCWLSARPSQYPSAIHVYAFGMAVVGASGFVEGDKFQGGFRSSFGKSHQDYKIAQVCHVNLHCVHEIQEAFGFDASFLEALSQQMWGVGVRCEPEDLSNMCSCFVGSTSLAGGEVL